MISWQRTYLTLMLTAVALPLGCSQPSWEEKTYEVRTVTPLDQAKQLLQGYVDGQSLGSEVDSYPQLVSSLRETDPAKADILEQGLEELRKSGSVKTAAKALLDKL
jgi:hypothetical protein